MRLLRHSKIYHVTRPTPPVQTQSLRKLLTGCLLSLLLTACDQPSTYDSIAENKTLHVITRNAPAVYYEGREGPMGFEYDLAKLFADELNLTLEVKVATNRSQILSALDNEYTHIAAASLVASEARANRYQYSQPYMETTPNVVYRYGSNRPASLKDIIGSRIAVVSDSYLVEELAALQQANPDLKWQALDIETIELMKMVEDQEIDYAIMTSTELDLHKAYYPMVDEAFKLGEAQQISWYFPKSTDRTFIDKVDAFFQRIHADGTLMFLKERYFGHLGNLDYVGARTFINHINNRLPKYDDMFRAECEKHGLDWRLMAAIGYQESHWQADAVSPTGVRGLMMLTQATAQEMGIENRLNARSSIVGGIRYFAKIKNRISDRIPEPDRTWFALAAYNIGYGHLEDARILTEKDGRNPDKWIDVKEYLPLLQKQKYYKQTRYGYARGNEPVIYVQNIRRYYDVLNWMTQPQPDEHAIAQSDLQSRQL